MKKRKLKAKILELQCEKIFMAQELLQVKAELAKTRRELAKAKTKPLPENWLALCVDDYEQSESKLTYKDYRRLWLGLNNYCKVVYK